MYKQKIMRKYIVLLAIGIAIALAFTILPGIMRKSSQASAEIEPIEEADEVAEVFNTYKEQNIKLIDYSKNFFVHILNGVMPAAKVSYEKSTGGKLPDFFTSALSSLADGANLDLANPRTYFKFVYTAFSQYDPPEDTVAIDDKATLPDITDFENAPEGAIYFKEDQEYILEQQEQSPINNEGGGIVTEAPSEAVDDPEKLAFEKKAPEVFIYHSHTSESYMPISTGNFHTMDDKYNVLSVGRIMTQVLEKQYKYKVLHDKTYHDTVSYAYSYANSLISLKENINKHKSLKVFLDVHRDGFSSSLKQEQIDERKKGYTVKVDKKDAARVMLVIGKQNPNYEELEKFAVYIKKKMDKLYPGLFLRIDKKDAKYNQYVSDYSMLIEIGCSYNTIEEANYTAELMGIVMGEVLKDLGK